MPTNEGRKYRYSYHKSVLPAVPENGAHELSWPVLQEKQGVHRYGRDSRFAYRNSPSVPAWPPQPGRMARCVSASAGCRCLAQSIPSEQKQSYDTCPLQTFVWQRQGKISGYGYVLRVPPELKDSADTALPADNLHTDKGYSTRAIHCSRNRLS